MANNIIDIHTLFPVTSTEKCLVISACHTGYARLRHYSCSLSVVRRDLSGHGFVSSQTRGGAYYVFRRFEDLRS